MFHCDYRFHFGGPLNSRNFAPHLCKGVFNSVSFEMGARVRGDDVTTMRSPAGY